MLIIFLLFLYFYSSLAVCMFNFYFYLFLVGLTLLTFFVMFLKSFYLPFFLRERIMSKPTIVDCEKGKIVVVGPWKIGSVGGGRSMVAAGSTHVVITTVF